MPSKSGGTYVPGWIFKAIQGFVVTAVVGGYGMFYSMHDDINKLKHQVEDLEENVAKLEGKLEEAEKGDNSIRESLATIEAQLPFIKAGISDLKDLLKP